MLNLDDDFKKLFPKLDFRLKDFQKKVISNVVEKDSTLCIMPTGGGKSAIYWMAAAELKGICIVISPLTALIAEQAQKIRDQGYETLEIQAEVARDNVFIQLDTFHAQKVDGNLSYLIQKFAGKYGHVQIASLPDRHEPCEGEINYDYIFSLFDKTGYSGYIGCEYNPKRGTEEGLTWFDRYKNLQ